MFPLNGEDSDVADSPGISGGLLMPSLCTVPSADYEGNFDSTLFEGNFDSTLFPHFPSRTLLLLLSSLFVGTTGSVMYMLIIFVKGLSCLVLTIYSLEWL